MTQKSRPVPLALAMVICDTFMEDRFTGKKSLIGIFNNIGTSQFPCRHPTMNVFCVLTEGIGQYNACLKCTNMSSSKSLISLNGPINFPNPLAIVEFNFNLNNILFNEPGQYAFELYCDDQLVASRKFAVTKIEPPQQTPPAGS